MFAHKIRYFFPLLFFILGSASQYSGTKPPRKVDQIFKLHEYYTHIAEMIDQSSLLSPNEKQIWPQILENLEGKVVIFPDGYHEIIETQILQRRLSGQKPAIHCEELGSPTEEEWSQIRNLQRQSFDVQSLVGQKNYKKETHITILKNHFNNGHRFLIAREDSGDIVGVLEYCSYNSQKNAVYIYTLCRKPSYGKCGIGSDLMRAFKQKANGHWDQLFLHVRTSNPAVLFYEAQGFIKEKEISSYYRFPEESAYLMQCHLP